MIWVRTARDLEYAENQDICLTTQLTPAMAARINRIGVRKVFVTPAVRRRYPRLIGAIRPKPQLVARRIRRGLEPLAVNALIFKDIRNYGGHMVLRPITALLYARRPQDIMRLEVVVPLGAQVPNLTEKHKLDVYEIERPYFELVKRRARILLLTCADFPGERVKVFVPQIHDAIQLQLNNQTIYALYDIVQQVRNLKDARFVLPYNHLQAEDWFNVIIKKREPRYIHNPFTMEDILREEAMLHGVEVR